MYIDIEIYVYRYRDIYTYIYIYIYIQQQLPVLAFACVYPQADAIPSPASPPSADGTAAVTLLSPVAACISITGCGSSALQLLSAVQLFCLTSGIRTA